MNTLPLIFAIAVAFLVLERVFPGRELPASPGWYLRTPRWTGWFMQRPEHHSIHHQREVHDFNYGDITWWDRMFGTFRDAGDFSPACGYHGDRERRLGEMLLFRDVNRA